MRPTLLSATALLVAMTLAGCSDQSSTSAPERPDAAADAAQSSADVVRDETAGPAIAGSAAPGVAFTYAYSFSLPAKAISAVQRDHAAACERFGPTRCRVTGLRYEQPRQDQVEARLDFLLAPDLAHSFASEGIAVVERAAGTLDHATVNGENAGDAIRVSQDDSAAIAGEIARLESRLKAKGLAAQERTELTRRLEDLNDQQRGKVAERRTKEASLASTPVSFVYASESLLTGDNTFAKAAAASLGSVAAALSFVMLLAGIALPWIGLAALVMLGWRWLRRRADRLAEPAPTA